MIYLFIYQFPKAHSPQNKEWVVRGLA